MDAIINLDFDFFFQPTYFGNYFGNKEWTSWEDFKATSTRWIDYKEFFEKIKLKGAIRGSSVKDNAQTSFYIKKMFDIDFVKRGETAIIQFDAHPNTYYWNKIGDVDKWGLAEFKPFNSTIAFFKEKLIDTIIWVVPDYVNEDIIKRHFENLEVSIEDNVFIPFVSSNFEVKLKMIKWTEFVQQVDNYNWKYFSFVMNSRMCNYSQEELIGITKHIKRY